MPRKTHPTTNNRRTPGTAPTEKPRRNNYETLARSLVERGLATINILDRPYRPAAPMNNGRQD